MAPCSAFGTSLTTFCRCQRWGNLCCNCVARSTRVAKFVTSHNEEAIRKFSGDNTWVMDRKSHLEPTLIRLLADLPRPADLIGALICGDVTL